MAEVKCLTSLAEFDALEPVWNNLAESAEYATVFQTFEWLHSWWQSFGNNHELNILTVYEGEKLAGIAPLMITPLRRFGRKCRSIQFIGTPESDYHDFLGADKKLIADAVIDYLVERESDWTDIDLDQVSERTPTAQILSERLKQFDLPVREQKSEECLAYIFEGTDEERAEFAPRRGKKLRNCINFFEKAGSLELRELRDAKEIEGELYNFFHQHITRWQDSYTPSRFVSREHQDFFFRLNRRLTSVDRLSMLALRYNDRPIAYEFNFDYKGTVCLYTGAHNVFYSRKSAGTIMNNFLVGHYVRNGTIELDFTRGAEAYKDSMTNRAFNNYRYRIFRRKLDLRIPVTYDRFKRTWVARAVMNNEWLMNWKRRFEMVYRREGLGGLGRKIFRKLIRYIFVSYDVIIFAQDGQLPPLKEPKLDVEFEKLDPSWADEVAGFMGATMDSEKHRAMLQKFDAGADCFACLYRGHIVSSGWGVYSEDYDPSDGFLLKTTGRQVICSDSFTSPAYRGLGIGKFRRHMEVELYHRDRYVCLCAIDEENRASIGVARALNFKEVDRRSFLKLLGLTVRKPSAVMVTDRTNCQAGAVEHESR